MVSPGDIHAVSAIQRLARISPTEAVVIPPINQTGNKSGGKKSINSVLPSIPISRRGFLQTTGLFVGGVTVAVVGQNLFRTQGKNPTSENTPSVNTPTPEITTSPEPTPTPENTTPVNNLKTFNFDVVKTDAKGSITKESNQQAKYFEEDLGNGVKLQMVQIPGGKFLMGSPASEKDRESDESPQHEVTVPGFFMGRYEVTQAQYQAIIGSNPSNFKGENRPVEQVSWDDAVKFCQALTERTGKTYRLPSEAEWEYACRAGTTTPFYFGESITPELVNYNSNIPYAAAPKGKYRQQTTEVGIFPPNSFGLYDMCGNTWEWCQDYYQNNYTGTPNDGRAWLKTISKEYRLMRGGSWSRAASGCRSANRHWHSPDARGNHYGFRVVVIVG
ncbi:formylglycine-generating enzyme family protein [Anabaena variabilis FACHB-164]|nr:formylglycine-generating enzyme family protein [Trichormus variabilis FACHB-164]